MATKFVPMAGQVVLRVSQGPEKSRGGLYLPHNVPGALSKHCEGVILAIGPQRIKQFEVSDDGSRCGVVPGTGTPRGFKVGDTVVYKSYGALEVTRAEESFIVIDETAVVLVLEEIGESATVPHTILG